MIITISGQAGSGKSSVARLLARKLGFRNYSMGDIRRKAAYERGITLAEFNKIGEDDDSTDRFVDDLQSELGEKENDIVVNGRTSFHFIPNSIKIYLHANLNVRSKRVLKSERKTEPFNTLEECRNALNERETSDDKRFRKWYGIDVGKRKNYDHWIDTTDLTVKQVVDMIIKLIGKD
jgi:cytidylate kinase